MIRALTILRAAVRAMPSARAFAVPVRMLRILPLRASIAIASNKGD